MREPMHMSTYHLGYQFWIAGSTCRGDEINPCNKWRSTIVKEASSNFSWAIHHFTGVFTSVAFHGGARRYQSNIECRAEADWLFTLYGVFPKSQLNNYGGER